MTTDSVKSWCDHCQEAATAGNDRDRDGHFGCTKPEAPAGHALTGEKELTETGWRERIAPIATLIPLPTKTTAAGAVARRDDWTWPRSEAYEAAARAALPAGWELYSVLAERAPTPEVQKDWDCLAGKDFGATRTDGSAQVFGIRSLDGVPLRLRASIPSRSAWFGSESKDFAASEIGAACRWCDERLAARSSASAA